MFGFTIIRQSKLSNLQGELNAAKRTIERDAIKISFLQTMKSELYDQLYNRSKDAKGRFCKKSN